MKNDFTYDWVKFLYSWSGIINFKFKTEYNIFLFEFPDVHKIIDILRKDNDVFIYSGNNGNILNKKQLNNCIKNISIEKFCENKFQLSHFKLEKYFKKNNFLYQFDKKILKPWKTLLRLNNFTWDRCYPIIFISGINSSTNYHLDYSHVLAWQIFGEKNFYSIHKPDNWVSIEERMLCNKLSKPKLLKTKDIIKNVIKPNELFWNTFLTPHWVESKNKISLSINISHGGLKHNNKLCKHEHELIKWRKCYNPNLGIIKHL